jgi:hypothetical protein
MMKDFVPWLWVGGLILFAIVVRVILGRWGGGGGLPYFSKEFLLSKGELAFYDVLRRSVPPGIGISMKVRLADVIGCSGAAWKEGYGGKITQKHLDFILFDIETTRIIAAVELDDRSHRRADRQDRDGFIEQAMAAAGVRLVRVPAAASYDARRLRELIAPRVAAA